MSPGEAKLNIATETRADDLRLARLAADGDSAAFRTLVDRHSAGLFRLCCSLTATRSDAEDLLQETFSGAFGGLKKFSGSSSVKTWLTSILMRQAAKAWHRNRHHRRTRSIDSAPGKSGGSTASDGSENQDANQFWTANSVTPGGSSSVVSGPTAQRQIDLQHDLKVVLAKMDPMFREILVLREMEQMSYDEIAQSLNVPRGTVESRLFRARGELKRLMKAYRID